jgi:hypothetical protein
MEATSFWELALSWGILTPKTLVELKGRKWSPNHLVERLASLLAA